MPCAERGRSDPDASVADALRGVFFSQVRCACSVPHVGRESRPDLTHLTQSARNPAPEVSLGSSRASCSKVRGSSEMRKATLQFLRHETSELRGDIKQLEAGEREV